MTLRIKNWDRYQHYRDRRPPWIKLHRSILDDRAFMLLPVEGKALLPMLWLLASESDDGQVISDLDDLEFRTRLPADVIRKGLQSVISSGLVDNASSLLADACPERETEGETEAEAEPEVQAENGFDEFWSAYDYKVKRRPAETAWNRVPKGLRQHVIERARAYRAATPEKRLRRHPTTWLHQRGWEDEDLPRAKHPTSFHHTPSTNGFASDL